MDHVVELHHPLVEHYLTDARNSASTQQEFRSSLNRLGNILAVEMTRKIVVAASTVHTPLEVTQGFQLHTSIALVPILRAGLALVDSFVELIPDSVVLHLGMYRNEETAQPVWYYNKLDEQKQVDRAFILDPMLATGGSVIAAIEALRAFGVGEIEVGCIIAAPEGLKSVTEFDANVIVTVCKIDERLDENCYIRPGLGDAGDRYFGTS